MIERILYRRMKKQHKKAITSLNDKNRLIRVYRRKVAELRKALAKVRREKAILEDGYVVEWCVHCERQIVMLWDVQEDGLTAFCPYCGQKMMLCEQCQGDCDYNYGTDICKEM